MVWLDGDFFKIEIGDDFSTTFFIRRFFKIDCSFFKINIKICLYDRTLFDISVYFKIWVAFLRGRGNFLKIKIKTFIFMVSLLSTALLLFASFIWALFSIKGLLQNINHPHFLIKNQDQYQDFARAFYFLSITFSFSLKHFRRAHF